MEGRSCKREAESAYHERMTAGVGLGKANRLVVTACCFWQGDGADVSVAFMELFGGRVIEAVC